MKPLKKSSRIFSDNFRRTHWKISPDYQNQFWSPFSAMSAIGMLQLGSKGDTKSQIQNVVFGGWKSTEIEEPHQSLLQLTDEILEPYKKGNNSMTIVANRMFIQEDFQLVQKFIDESREFYSSGGTFGSIDFGRSEEARNTINSWVEKATKDKITDLLPEGSVSPDTKLVLINAIHFLGNWKHQFNSSLTKQRDFHIQKSQDNGKTKKPRHASLPSTVKVDMMSLEGKFTFCRLDGIDAEMLKLDYEDERLSMLIVLPDKEAGLKEVSKNFRDFNKEKCGENERSLHAVISIPKFKIEAEYKMKDILTEMGMKDAFDEKKANLSGISNKGCFQLPINYQSTYQLFVDEIYHKAFLNVDEKGTEAAAATGIVMNLESLPKTFTCDRPFSFMIVENKFGSVLFEGLVADPSVAVEAKTE